MPNVSHMCHQNRIRKKTNFIVHHFHSILLDGYAKNIAGDRCLPVCTECVNGKCIAPGECKCSAGYGGPACDISKIFDHYLFNAFR